MVIGRLLAVGLAAMAFVQPGLGAPRELRWLALNNVIEGEVRPSSQTFDLKQVVGYGGVDAYAFRAKQGQRLRFNIVSAFGFKIDIERIDKVDPLRTESVANDEFAGFGRAVVNRTKVVTRTMQSLESTPGDKSFTWAVPSEGVYRIALYAVQGATGAYKMRTWDLESTSAPVQLAATIPVAPAPPAKKIETATPAGRPTPKRADPPPEVARTKPAAAKTAPKTILVEASKPPAKPPASAPAAAKPVVVATINTITPAAAVPPARLSPVATRPMLLPRKAGGWIRKVGPRVALVIGNSSYVGMGALPNPANDARQVAGQLQEVGFEVELVLDADQLTMKRAVSRLGDRMAKAGQGATGLFYFAGHGIQSRGVNYLIPTGAQISKEADVDLESVAADSVLLQMQEANSSTNIVILDACRNMPLTRSFRNAGQGLARMNAPTGSFISYSTAPGSVAYDGEGQNSPFAAALSTELRRKGEPIEIVFRSVRRKVLEATEGQQTPWDSSSLLDAFVFLPN